MEQIMPIDFWKMNGSGNDFILINNMDGRIGEKDMSFLVEKTCRRRESVGADGVIFLVKSDKYDFAWHFFNADGSEVEMCGNGSRCVARFAYLNGIAGKEMVFGTKAGPVKARVEGRRVKVLMPSPSDYKSDIPIDLLGEWKGVDFINTGVPHVVVLVDYLSDYPVVEHGRKIRYNPLFAPEGTNANFMQVVDRDMIEVRTYERGVEDETLACGTGSIACALSSYIRGLVRSPVTVKTRGGDILTIHFAPKDEAGKGGDLFDEVWLEGNTTIVYEAVLHNEALMDNA